MNTQPTQDNSNDDQELAKALAGMADPAPAPAMPPASGDMTFEETPAPSGAVAGSPFGEPADTPQPAAEPVVAPIATPAAPTSIPSLGGLDTSGTGGLDGIKKDALNELRPLVDKLSVPPEEKFDTYLLLLRSTDDTSLIGPAHEAAKEIPDEARRAQALLDVIKEIDYLSSTKAA